MAVAVVQNINQDERRPLDCAYEYAKLGLKIVPLKPMSKRPLRKGWRKQCVPTETEIDKWLSSCPNSNIAMVLGKYVVIDIDSIEGEQKLHELSNGDLPDTWTICTGRGGKHLTYAIPNGIKLKTEHLTGLDFLAEGSLSVLPPSIHPSGKAYKWEDSKNPFVFGPATLAPQWLIERLKEKAVVIEFPRKQAISETQKPVLPLEPPLAGRIQELVQHEQLAADLYRYCGGKWLGLNTAIKCPIHEDNDPSAEFYRMDDGTIGMVEFHDSTKKTWLLAEVYASVKCGKEMPLKTKSQKAMWFIRMLLDLGWVRKPVLPHKELPTKLAKNINTKRVFDGFSLAIQCQYAYEGNTDVMFTDPFAMEWCNLSRKEVRNAKIKLKNKGLIVKTGKQRPAGGHKANIYALGQAEELQQAA